MPRLFRLPRPSPLSALIALAFGAGAPALAQQAPASEGVALMNSRVLGAPTRTGGKAALAISAGKITAQADQQAEASDAVELRYGEVLLNADQLTTILVGKPKNINVDILLDKPPGMDEPPKPQ